VEVVSPDALALVRFGLRAPDDPRVMNTVKVIDELLRVILPQGPGWYRYNCDGYGEHEDGSPFDGTGIGRPWPLLAGERAHYELAAGRAASAEALLEVMENSTGASRLTSRSANCSRERRRVRRARWCGRTLNTSSCAGRWLTEGFSISLHKRWNAT
jgi:hypothetical protein